MPPERFRVDVDGDPFLLRSAVFQSLRADPRFDVVLVESTGEPDEASVVLTVDVEGPLRLQPTREGTPLSIAYEGMQLLAETLATELSKLAPNTNPGVTGHA